MAASPSRKADVGGTSPADDPAAELQTWTAGDYRRNDDEVTLATGLGGWFCSVSGHPGTWIALYVGAG
ncbi:MAG: hypothetical protein ND807_00130, partial [Vicinamibacterales bacterium]|nr:hypothetical protein [Vicinamibacterales bacterium]